MEEYLKIFHAEDITDLLNDACTALHVSINVNLNNLQRNCPELYLNVIANVWDTLNEWNQALLNVQKQLIEGNAFLDPEFQIKENCHVRFMNLPQSNYGLRCNFPCNDHIGLFLQIKGTVVRMTQSKLLEYKREYICNRCKESFVLEAQYKNMYIIDPPRYCLNSSEICKGILYPKPGNPKSKYFMDYQEIRVQELLAVKNVPLSIIVTLENDLVDSCQPGECVTVCGTIEHRWRPFIEGKRFEVIISMRAISVCKDKEKCKFGKDLSEQLFCVRTQWQEAIDTNGLLNTRDTIIRSISPEIHGMYLVKLAIALSLCSGFENRNIQGSSTTRGHSHLLLVGDPGLAKSRLLKTASKISIRSVHTTGMGCSAAGLTAAAIKEDGEWQLEAGALVLADGGVCCIDEFNLMRETDKAAIHEAMEQQTISIAKAGLVCKLSTRCVILAAINPKNVYTISENEGLSTMNIGISSPLLSRFDVVLILSDQRSPELDSQIADHLIETTDTLENMNIDSNIWDLERLQSHFLAISEIYPVISNEANEIIGKYYKYCRLDPMRDPARTSVRLLDSLNRLTQAHARLTFREKAEAIDAIVIIRLMESSWGFGRLLYGIDVINENLPIGPSKEQIHEILNLLSLQKLEENIMKNYDEFVKSFNSNQNKISPKKKNSTSELRIENLEDVFGYRPVRKKFRKFIEHKIDNTNSNTNNLLNEEEKDDRFDRIENIFLDEREENSLRLIEETKDDRIENIVLDEREENSLRLIEETKDDPTKNDNNLQDIFVDNKRNENYISNKENQNSNQFNEEQKLINFFEIDDEMVLAASWEAEKKISDMEKNANQDNSKQSYSSVENPNLENILQTTKSNVTKNLFSNYLDFDDADLIFDINFDNHNSKYMPEQNTTININEEQKEDDSAYESLRFEHNTTNLNKPRSSSHILAEQDDLDCLNFDI